MNAIDPGLVAKAGQEEPVGDLIARALADAGVTHAFGVISIHNMPILDAICARTGSSSCPHAAKPAR